MTEEIIKEEFDKAFKKNFPEAVIIDDVNVAGCEYYTTMEDCDGIHDLCEQLDDYCSIKKNRYYKQLKRLEQENKDLKKQVESQKGLITVGGKQQYEYLQKINELEQENKEMKSALEEIKGTVQKGICSLRKGYNREYQDTLSNIFNKINEVLGNE